MDGSRALILFTRSPDAEARAKGLPRRAGGALFSALLRSWAAGARTSGARLFVSAPNDCLESLREMALDRDVRFLAQEHSGFGLKLQSAARKAFAAGAASVVIAGGDCPAPAGSVLEGAFRALEGGFPAVLGPARDGGLYLIGLRTNLPGVLETIRPRDPRGFRRCVRRIAREAGAPRILPAERDLDGPGDLFRLCQPCGRSAAWRRFGSLLVRLILPVPARRWSPRRSARRGFRGAVAQRGPPPALLRSAA